MIKQELGDFKDQERMQVMRSAALASENDEIRIRAMKEFGGDLQLTRNTDYDK